MTAVSATNLFSGMTTIISTLVPEILTAVVAQPIFCIFIGVSILGLGCSVIGKLRSAL